MAEKKARCIFSSIDAGYDYDSYKEWCEDMDETPSPENSWDYINWVNRMIENDYEDLIANIKCSKNNGRCVITGKLGLWWGRPEIKEEEQETLVDAIKRCNTNDYLEVYENEEDGSVEVHSIHHDGTNIFNIYPLTNSGKKGKYPKYLY